MQVAGPFDRGSDYSNITSVTGQKEITRSLLNCQKYGWWLLTSFRTFDLSFSAPLSMGTIAETRKLHEICVSLVGAVARRDRKDKLVTRSRVPSQSEVTIGFYSPPREEGTVLIKSLK